MTAQYHYWPAGFANQPGGSAQATPFSISPNTATSNTRALCTLKAASLPFGPGTVLNELAFRRDSQHATGYPAVNGNLRVKIGVVPDAMRPSGRFQSAWLGEPQQVFNGTPFSLPNAPFPGSGTAAPFDLVIPFTKPFTYLGGDLGIDIEWTGPPNTDWKRDAIQLPFDQSGDFRALGAGCPGSTTYGPNLWVDVQNLRPGGSINLRLDGCAPPALASFYLGLPTTSPVPLSPFGLGATCAAHIGPALTWNSLVGDVSTRYARARLDLPLPNDPLLIGAPLSFQALALDFFVASSAPFVSSNAIDVICGAPSGIAPVEYGRTIWVWGSRGNNRVDGSFVSPPNYVPVIRFG
ncbi:MAG: hypothetical protein ACE37K_12840 [Planctomycetota bacterium]